MRIRLLTSLLALLIAADARAQPLLGTVAQHSFIGPVTGAPVHYSLYLPPGYSATHGRYPVVYHLHGLGGSHAGPQTAQVASRFEAAHLSGLIGPVILVFANGYVDSFWADGFDGSKPAETNVVAELIPHIDATCRTQAGRCGRLVQGFSMGGFGAAKFQSKFPELFAGCVIYDAAMVTWSNMVQFHPEIAASVFGGQEAYYNQHSPWHWTVENADVLVSVAAFRSVVGALVFGNQQFRNQLNALGIPLQYVETGCAHALPCLLDAQMIATMSFVEGRLGSGVAGDLNCDGRVNQADLGLVLADFGCMTFCPSDVDGDGDVDQSDLAIVLAAFGA